MNIEELINHLEKIKKEIGNVDVLFERVAYQYYDEIEYEIVPLKEENVEKKVMFSYIKEVDSEQKIKVTNLDYREQEMELVEKEKIKKIVFIK